LVLAYTNTHVKYHFFKLFFGIYHFLFNFYVLKRKFSFYFFFAIIFSSFTRIFQSRLYYHLRDINLKRGGAMP
jgi:hypothetical protein